jgi:hypothetical protein
METNGVTERGGRDNMAVRMVADKSDIGVKDAQIYIETLKYECI